MKTRSFLGATIFLLATPACAPVTQAPVVDSSLAAIEAEKQRQLVVDRQLNDSRRLHHVTFNILSSNVGLCREKGKTAKKPGLQLTSPYVFPREFRSAAKNILGGEGIVVLTVTPASPADIAGFQEGDVLKSLNGNPVPSGERAIADLAAQMNDLFSKGDRAVFVVARNSTERVINASAVEVCNYSYGVAQNPGINAFADGKSIVVTNGMMRFASTDDELATVVGHELAHNLMGHIDSKMGNAAIGLVFDLLLAGFGVNTQGAFSNMAGQAYSQEFETEADYVGLYLMTQAGYNIKNSPTFWRRMGVEHPSSIRDNHAASHPSAPYRFTSLDKTVEEIDRKRGQGLALRPEEKKKD
ncbi:MAG: PDZ domain-containing protein [Alphaproteobacteria bacterium]|nr:PDZ domain-containing protein [Alphaproteobacteria bacterium]